MERGGGGDDSIDMQETMCSEIGWFICLEKVGPMCLHHLQPFAQPRRPDRFPTCLF